MQLVMYFHLQLEILVLHHLLLHIVQVFDLVEGLDLVEVFLDDEVDDEVDEGVGNIFIY